MKGSDTGQNPEVRGCSGLLGTVMAHQANFYKVRLDSPSNCFLLCTRRSRLKKIGQKVMVGDRVVVESAGLDQGVIDNVLPRESVLKQPPVANANQILLVFALSQPNLDVLQLSRFLVKAESTGLKICLALNKIDLIAKEEQEAWYERLSKWGYEPVLFSVNTKEGIDKLLSLLENQITIVAGPSGVGKSSLISTLVPAIPIRVGSVSQKIGRGRHTTRHVELFELGENGFLADTPGFNQPDVDYSPTSLAFYFPEARLRLEDNSCQFADCLHRDEPNCVVRGDWERYSHYLTFLDEAKVVTEAQQNLPDSESSLKLKVKADGKHHYEPKLQTKKYRRVSRRQKHQVLQELYVNRNLDELSEKFED